MSAGDSIIPLILAGGRGTRIAHLQPDVPKPALRIAGKPFLCWILQQLRNAGFEQAIVSGGHLAEVLEREVSSGIPGGMSVRWVHEKAPLGTAGGSAYASRLSGWKSHWWLVMNGDSYLGGAWPSGISEMQEPALVARKIDDVSRYGSLQMKDGLLAGFHEKGAAGPGLINAGIYLLPDEWLREIPSEAVASMEQEMMPRWIASGRRIRVLQENAPFIDIGTPETLAKAETFFRQPEILAHP